MPSEHGKFIVLYGINNLGKSTQAQALVKRLIAADKPAVYLKYPVYELEPTGPNINRVLRSEQKQQLTEIDFQALYAQNRRDYQPTLEQTLAAGTTVVAEDYTGTGIAWGLAKGAALEALEAQNADLRKEDVTIWLDGQRFLDGREVTHLHESNDALVERCRQTHAQLAQRYGWLRVDANQPIAHVADAIWQIL